MKSRIVSLVLALALSGAASAAPDALLKLPDFDALSAKAIETVNITLDSALLGVAARFLDSGNPEDAAVKEVIGGLQGIYVRSYTFEEDFAYPKADVESVRRQLSAPGWQPLVQIRSRKDQADVDIYISLDHDKANGLVIIASEPREFTIVNIIGSIDLEKLHRLEGQFGIPKLELEQKKAGAEPVP